MRRAAPFVGLSNNPGPGLRLRQARIEAGFDSVRAFAHAIELNATTVAQHENGLRAMLPEAATEYARRLNVTPAWLLFGPSQPIGVCRIVGTVSDSTVTLLSEPEHVSLEAPGVDGNYDILDIKDASIEPYACKGDLVYYRRPQPLASFGKSIDDEYCVVFLTTGAVVVRRVLVQSNKVVTLLWTSRDGVQRMANAAVLRISPVEWVRKRRSVPHADAEAQPAAA
ncbi:MAG TPA: helix-turn-helix transcriptional regulator [Candidatus Limnocylindrales bacterium]|nr:helix-turn-helix transcriptional regulator [Candidatus Limnocylindrales bacterium]